MSTVQNLETKRKDSNSNTIETPIEKVLARFPDAKPQGQGWLVCCPAHDDRRPSLSITATTDGTVLLKCHAGCDTKAVCAALGLRLADLFNNPAVLSTATKPVKSPAQAEYRRPLASKPQSYPSANAVLENLEKQLGPRAATWTYHNADGQPVGLVARWDSPNGKEIRPVRWSQDGWQIGAMPKPRPLYNLSALATTKLVLVCEGEKAADAACSLGFIATTSAGGAQAAKLSDWQPLAGKEVWILPDNDGPGRKYANEVTALLQRLQPPTTARIIELPDLPPQGDIVDWIRLHVHTQEPQRMKAELETLATTHNHQPNEPATRLDFRPFPMTILPEPLQSFVQAGAKALRCDPSYLAVPLLTSCAAAIGNSRRLQIKSSWLVPPILWTVLVGESGSSKSPALRSALQAARHIQRRLFAEQEEIQAQYEKELRHWDKQMHDWKRSKNASSEAPDEPKAPPLKRFIVNDTTVEALAPLFRDNPRGLLLERDELSSWFGSFDRYAAGGKAGADEGNWLSLYNAESLTIDRKTGLPRTIHVPMASLCICGGIQPLILQQALGNQQRASGLAARFMFAYPPPRAKLWTEDEIPEQLCQQVVNLMVRLYLLAPQPTAENSFNPVILPFTPQAKQLWLEHINAHNTEALQYVGDFRSAWSKLEEIPARLALVLHCVRVATEDGSVSDPNQVDETSLAMALALTDWFKHEAQRIYGLFEEDDSTREERKLLDWIRQKEGRVSVREVQQGYRPLKAPGTAQAALDALVKAAVGCWQDEPRDAQGGRPTKIFVLKPVSTVYETPKNPVQYGGFVDVDSPSTTATTPVGLRAATSESELHYPDGNIGV